MNYLDFANKDLKSAETLFAYTDEYDVIVVSCQQYLEKFLKYLLLEIKGELSKSHKLTVLSKKLELIELEQYEDFFRKVQDYYFDKRYPGENYIETTKEECNLVFVMTHQIKDLLETLLVKYKPKESLIKSNSFSTYRES